jgi:predicted nucleic-acid-binding Zn-ribbon protein
MLQQRNAECPKCRRVMEQGFIADASYGAILIGSWLEGAPEKGWTGSVKMKGKRKLHITAYRCTSCGYLEFYANPQIMTLHSVNIDRLKSLGR